MSNKRVCISAEHAKQSINYAVNQKEMIWRSGYGQLIDASTVRRTVCIKMSGHDLCVKRIVESFSHWREEIGMLSSGVVTLCVQRWRQTCDLEWSEKFLGLYWCALKVYFVFHLSFFVSCLCCACLFKMKQSFRHHKTLSCSRTDWK